MTFEAILEATIQVLLSRGLDGVTTTRVAARAGVSIGTVYQYFQDKSALFYAVLIRHFETMAQAMESAGQMTGEPSLSEIAERIATAYADAKLVHPDATRALYNVAGAIGQDKFSAGAHSRLESAIAALLAQAADVRLEDPRRAAFVIMSALTGLTRTIFQRGDMSAKAIELYKSEAILVAKGYLLAVHHHITN